MGDGLMSDTIERIEPLVFAPSKVSGQPQYTVAGFKGSDWSLKPLQRAGDEKKAPELARRVSQAGRSLGARLLLAPTPTKFNGELVSPRTLMKERLLLGDIVLYRNPDAPADGTWLEHEGCAGIFSLGGCAFIVGTRGKKMIAAHAGRDCVLDRERILTENRATGRGYGSVVYSILSRLASSPSEMKGVHVAVYYSIKPEDFRHNLKAEDPEHAKYNKAAHAMLPREYGPECGIVDELGIGIDVPSIIKRQCIAYGVPDKHISLEHAYLSDELPTTRRGDVKGRYLGIIVRNS